MVEYYQGFRWEKLCWKSSPGSQTPVPNDLSDPIFSASQTDEKTRKLFEVYNEVVYWKPVFFILGKNTAGYEIFNQLNILLQPLAIGKSRSNVRMIAAMDLLPLVRAKTKDSYDSSIAKTISRRISQWKRGTEPFIDFRTN